MRENTISSATAVTISGTINGWLMKAYLKVSPRYGLVRVVASAAIVAVIVARMAATAAIWNERIEDSITSVLFQATWNQRSEKPFQIASDSLSLKAKTTSVPIGR